MRVLGLPVDLYIQCTALQYANNCRRAEKAGFALLDRKHTEKEYWQRELKKALCGNCNESDREATP